MGKYKFSAEEQAVIAVFVHSMMMDNEKKVMRFARELKAHPMTLLEMVSCMAIDAICACPEVNKILIKRIQLENSSEN